MQNPTNRFGECITGIDDSRDMFECNIATLLPFLDCKVLNIDMTGTFSWFSSIHHVDSRHVILMNDSGLFLGES